MKTGLIHRPTRRHLYLVAIASIPLSALPGCHHTSSGPVEPAPAAQVKVGYGEQSRAQTGGAVQSVSGEELKHQKAARVEDLLEGRFPGLHVIRTPGGGISVRIRGVSTVLGNREPLYVIDGIPVEIEPGRGVDWLSPAEIQRIDVLKDPAETSMYGVRGANGVILITTKRPL